MSTIEERLTVRDRNQITIPKLIADVRDIQEGRSVIAHIDDSRPHEIVLRIVPDSYAGALTNIFDGTDAQEYVDSERADWE